MREGYIRMFIPWLRIIIKTTAFRSYRSLLSILLRLIRHCQSVVNGKERDFRERPGLASSCQPVANQVELTPPVSLAVLSPLQTQGLQPGTDIQMPNPRPYDTQSPRNLSALPILAMVPPHTMPGRTLNVLLIPIVPEPQVKRYSRNVQVDKKYRPFEVKKGPLNCSEELDAVEGWEPLVQPEGALFFYHPDKKVFTDANAQDLNIVVKLDAAVEKARNEAHNAGIFLHPCVELALELMVVGGEEMWGYYFADHERRVIFWFEDHTSELLMNNVRGVKRKSHIKYALESQYWRHIELFPNKRVLPEDIVVTLEEIVMHTHAEHITSEICLAPFAPDEVQLMLGLVNLLRGSTKKEREHSVWIAARFMRLFCNTKFVNFYGQPGARLDANQSLYGDHDTRLKHIILRIMNVILFGAPDVQSKAIHRIWVDETIVQPRWKNLTRKLTTEWNGYTIFSTVMLVVNISYLAVPDVVNQTTSIILGYLSSICIMGSLVVSLILAEQVNDSRRSSAADAASFILRMSQSVLGLESLALMLSLPFALLIWGMMLFVAALSFTAFSIPASGVASYVIITPIWFTVITVVVWPLLSANDYHPWIWIGKKVSPRVGGSVSSHV